VTKLNKVQYTFFDYPNMWKNCDESYSIYTSVRK